MIVRIGIPEATAADVAAAAYARIAAGDRRAGLRLLDRAIQIGDDPRVVAWSRDRGALARHWSADAYVIARRGGSADIAAVPVLGGGQSGAAITYVINPLDRRPLSLTLRGTAAGHGLGIDTGTIQGSVGVGWRMLPGITISGERLMPLGGTGRSRWSLRIAGGADGRRLGIDLASYAEAGLVGAATYAAAQIRADIALPVGRVSVHPGAGAWASLQHDARLIGRLDAGPALRLSAASVPFSLSVDYRVRLAGNVAPGSGPVITLSTIF